MQQLNLLIKISKKQLYCGLASIVLGICIVSGMMWKGQSQPKPVEDDVALVQTTVIRVAEAAQDPVKCGAGTKVSLLFKSAERS